MEQFVKISKVGVAQLPYLVEPVALKTQQLPYLRN